MIKICKVNPIILKTNELENLFLTNNKIVNKYNHLDSLNTIDKYKDLFLASFIETDNDLFIVENSSIILGIITFTKSSDWNEKDQYKLTISLCGSIIDESILYPINQLIQDKLDKYGEIAVVSYNNELDELIKKYVNKVNLRCNYYNLKKADIDINLLNKNIKEYEVINKDLSIKFTDSISEEYIEQYCELFTETMKDMTDVKENGYEQYIITPEKQRQINNSFMLRNISHYCYMIFNSGNEMVAKSNVSVNNTDPRFPYQFMIGVKRGYRGRNLGKWLYASMYKRLLENVDFEQVLVSHHPENKPAISISEWIGYKLSYLETTHTLYK